MCSICGCGATSMTPHHDHPHDRPHRHAHDRSDDIIDFSEGSAALHMPGSRERRTIRVARDILSRNDAFARSNRARLRDGSIFALNLVSSPGSGKTSLLVRAIADLGARWPLAVIEGDQQTAHDAERIRAAGAVAVQINTGHGCHLDAHMVGHALDRLTLVPGSLLFIENVGNLVCPASFDLGEAHKVVVLSVTEGEDKPLKYPDMFAAADIMLINKSDLLAHVAFDLEACRAAALRVNPRIEIMTVSAHTGDGLSAFYGWIERRAAADAPAVASVRCR